MNELGFLEKWESEKPIYTAWGNFVVKEISDKLINDGFELDVFLKVPAKIRLKADQSLVDKAFYRAGKNYSDPYKDIEDKVGVRFVVLLLDDIKAVSNVVEGSEYWDFDACKHFEKDKEDFPLLFTYQSVHYIVRPRSNLEISGLLIPKETPCELQIRTLMQHAHAELTHDAIYKTKRTVQPKIHRTVAKSMAFIETADEFFGEVSSRLNGGPLQEFGILDGLDGLYESSVGIKPLKQKSSLIVFNEFETFLDGDLLGKIRALLQQYPNIPERVRHHYPKNSLYQQSVSLFIYWLLKRKKTRLLRDWPLDRKLLDPFASDLGISLWDGE